MSPKPHRIYPSCSLAALALGCMGGIGVVLAERLLAPSPTVATVDLSALVTHRVTRPDVVGLPDAARAEDAAQFASRLEREVGQLAREHGALLLSAPAVLAGAPDLTDVLRTRLERQEEQREAPPGGF